MAQKISFDCYLGVSLLKMLGTSQENGNKVLDLKFLNELTRWVENFKKCLNQVKNLNFKNHENKNDEIMIVYVQFINLKYKNYIA